VPGEKTDVFHSRFTIRNPSITSVTRNGNPSDPPTSVRVTFDEPMNVDTFTTASVTSFTDPAGQPIAVNKVTPVDGSNGRQFDVFFDAQRTFGTYQIVIGPDILDLFDNPMLAAFTGNFLVTPVYTAQEYPFEDLDIHGQPGTFRVIQYEDDLSVPVDLGTHTFNFYGVIYTGNNRLFASSNALITFGMANAAYVNTNLTNSPPEPAIAPLWSDWIKLSGTDMLEGLIDGNRLILQWNEIQHYSSTPRGITFQLILTLDTGGLPGDIIFNYVDLDTGEPVHSNGRSSTVGLKDRGNQGPDRLLVSFNALNPLIGSNQAIFLSANGGGQFAPSGRSRLGLGEQIAALVGEVSAPAALVLT